MNILWKLDLSLKAKITITTLLIIIIGWLWYLISDGHVSETWDYMMEKIFSESQASQEKKTLENIELFNENGGQASLEDKDIRIEKLPNNDNHQVDNQRVLEQFYARYLDNSIINGYDLRFEYKDDGFVYEAEFNKKQDVFEKIVEYKIVKEELPQQRIKEIQQAAIQRVKERIDRYWDSLTQEELNKEIERLQDRERERVAREIDSLETKEVKNQEISKTINVKDFLKNKDSFLN